jgi:hypothetical protein
VEQVGQDQLLMLLLVVEPELHEGRRRRRQRPGEQPPHAVVHLGAVIQHGLNGRPGHQPSSRAGPAFSDGLV